MDDAYSALWYYLCIWLVVFSNLVVHASFNEEYYYIIMVL